MNNLLPVALLSTMAFSPVIEAKAKNHFELSYNQSFDKTDQTIYRLQDLSNEMFEDFAKGKINQQIIVSLQSGDVIPFKISISGDIISLDKEISAVNIKANQDFFIKFSPKEEDFSFSKDLKTWKPFEDFAGGNISLGVGNYDGKVEGNFSFAANLKA